MSSINPQVERVNWLNVVNDNVIEVCAHNSHLTTPTVQFNTEITVTPCYNLGSRPSTCKTETKQLVVLRAVQDKNVVVILTEYSNVESAGMRPLNTPPPQPMHLRQNTTAPNRLEITRKRYRGQTCSQSVSGYMQTDWMPNSRGRRLARSTIFILFCSTFDFGQKNGHQNWHQDTFLRLLRDLKKLYQI